ncbi:PP_RS20740 family protein [Morganella morganii]|uniref:PP_RS20740 family protein n=1 Tax=Morganella morganii TaxID=582 RepID=UPI00228B35F3|nr:hypothetical protein [Morganella morganii]
MGRFDSDDSLFDVDDVAGKVSHLAPNHFMPWHKPRKQYIRDRQWVEHLVRLIRQSKFKHVDTINYFGLPGGDLLDINYIHKGLSRTSKYNGKKLGFHGLIDNVDDYNKAQGEFTKLLDMEDISNQSRLDNFNFEDLIKHDSAVWARIKNFGTYHFINLDFCNNILTDKTLPSLHYLLQYQMQKAVGMPWLLCITTRLNKDSANKNIMEKFQIVINEVVQGGALGDKIKSCFNEAYECMRTLDNLNSADNKILVNQILQICLVLWILKSAIALKNKIELKSSFKYSVDLFKRESDMHSFVFSFEKPEEAIPDCIGIVSVKETEAVNVNYEVLASSAIDKLSKTLDVDEYLDERPEELDKYANEMMELLRNCGYDVSGYKKFMNDEYGYKCSLT